MRSLVALFTAYYADIEGGVMQIYRDYGVPVVAICGSVDGLNRAQTTQFDVVMPSIQKIESIH